MDFEMGLPRPIFIIFLLFAWCLVLHSPGESHRFLLLTFFFNPLVNYRYYGKSPFFIGKASINGPFPMAMLVYQRVILQILIFPYLSLLSSVSAGQIFPLIKPL
jgi:hypothetical protein